METSPSYGETEYDLNNGETIKNFLEKSECQEKNERPISPSSDASTSGVCSLASSDFESLEENYNKDNLKYHHHQQEEEEEEEDNYFNDPVIIYQKRNLLNVFDNIYPYSVFQTTNVPQMNLSNYWERRSIYHRLGPYGKINEFDLQKCFLFEIFIIKLQNPTLESENGRKEKNSEPT
ncbi:hypothetical protein Phum_PHUM463140 [Pediculus humanus corporis]|uniref:Uncharacterized protein n=1 Tax=Pediculus humanus subsp. corporis TaxID=121224 RepID=E0VVG0_PEDHC|nr:uncharacterized protein Phum_PHUM463140 [Pediculus humanus corporis]EEB17366.1 hypothetical protein Phum_PHUM463140 [Pediculus humanus corporis]